MTFNDLSIEKASMLCQRLQIKTSCGQDVENNYFKSTILPNFHTGKSY